MEHLIQCNNELNVHNLAASCSRYYTKLGTKDLLKSHFFDVKEEKKKY